MILAQQDPLWNQLLTLTIPAVVLLFIFFVGNAIQKRRDRRENLKRYYSEFLGAMSAYRMLAARDLLQQVLPPVPTPPPERFLDQTDQIALAASEVEATKWQVLIHESKSVERDRVRDIAAQCLALDSKYPETLEKVGKSLEAFAERLGARPDLR